MGLGHSPSIVTSGLVLYLDAANIKSYPRTGTTWTDLIGNGNNGTLTNGVSYSNGDMVFDGVNNYIAFPVNIWNHNTGNPFTISCWFKSTQGTGGTIFGQNSSNTPAGNTGYVPVIYLRSDGKIRTETFWTGSVSNAIVSSSAYNDGKYHNVVCTFSAGTQTLYIDSQYIGQLTSTTQTSYSSSYYYFLGAGNPGGRSLGTSYFSGSISSFSFHNRALSVAEVQQNFNALRGRYGL